jgi:hypothetical protein
MGLHLALQVACLILQLPARALERVVHGEFQVGMPFVGRSGTVDIDLAAARKRHAYIDFILPAGAVVAAGCFQHHAAGDRTAEAFLQRGHMLGGSMPWKSISRGVCMMLASVKCTAMLTFPLRSILMHLKVAGAI